MGDFELLGGDGDETRLLVHRASGYSVPLPGHPRMAAVPSGTPAYGAILTLTDVAVEHGFRLDHVPTATDPQALAKALAQAYATERAAVVPKIKPVPARLHPDGVSGAHAVYQLREPTDATMEQVWVLVRPTTAGVAVLYHTTRFRTADLNHVQWAHVRTSIIDQHEWDPGKPRTAAPALWPASAIALPSVRLGLTDAATSDAVAKTSEIGPLADAQTDALVDLLREIAMTDDPPRFELPAVVVELHTRRLAMCGPTRAVEALLKNIGACKTALDLRGWVWQSLWALGNRDERDRHQRSTN